MTSIPDPAGGQPAGNAHTTASQSPPGPESGQSQDAQAANTASPNTGDGNYVVKSGDCILSIAKETGHYWAKLWNDPGNAELRSQREKAHQLLAGDRVHVPRIEPKHEPGETESRHRFVRLGEPVQARLYLRDAKRPYNGDPYSLEIDGRIYEGNTAPDGSLVVPVPGNAKSGTLRIRGRTFTVQLGKLDPVSTISGIQQRLKNLGHDPGEVTGELNDNTRGALRAFQTKHGLDITGEPDDEAQQKLDEIHDQGASESAAGAGDDSQAFQPDEAPPDSENDIEVDDEPGH